MAPTRTELLITVKPLVITNDREMMKVTEELRMQIRKASELEKSIKSRDSGS